MIYLLDANVFIEAKNRYYGFDFCPAFWDWLTDNQAIIYSIDKVKEELVRGNDKLAEWVKSPENFLFHSFDEKSTVHFTTINTWINTRSYKQSAIQKFQDGADYYLVAYAKEHDLVVVTREVSDLNSKIKIPDVCRALGIDYVDTFEMLRTEKARFVLKDSIGTTPNEHH